MVLLILQKRLQKQNQILQQNSQEKQALFLEKDFLQESQQKELNSQQILFEKRLEDLEKLRNEEKQTFREQLDNLKLETEKNWQNKLDLLREQFKTLSETMLKEKSASLTEANKEQINNLLQPLSKDIKEFKAVVESSREKGVELNSKLGESLKQLLQSSSAVSKEAAGLAQALKGNNKVIGNWGEISLERILQSLGFQKDIHYLSQETLADKYKNTIYDSNQRRMVPDIIIKNPDGADTIIDSKVSLLAYTEYNEAENEEQQTEALNKHLKSVRAHLNSLNSREYLENYKKYHPETFDYIIMFIPHEGSWQLAMSNDKNLWKDAFDKKILIVSPTNLLAILQIINNFRIKMEQEQNLEEIINDAQLLLNRVHQFLEIFDNVGKSLEKAQSQYKEAIDKLKDGHNRHSIVKIAKKLTARGVKLNKNRKLPQRFIRD